MRKYVFLLNSRRKHDSSECINEVLLIMTDSGFFLYTSYCSDNFTSINSFWVALLIVLILQMT